MVEWITKMSMGAALMVLCACQSGPEVAAPASEENKYADRLQIGNIANLLQTAPDEFSVITKRPLEMPQSFAALPVPEPGKRSTRDPDPLADARAALAFDPVVPAASGRTVAVRGAPSATEAAILAATGPVDPNIRATLATEQVAYEAEQERYFLERFVPALRDARVNVDALDAEEERLRLLEAGIVPGRTAGVVAPAPVQAPVVVVPRAVVPVAPAAASSTGTPNLIYLP